MSSVVRSKAAKKLAAAAKKKTNIAFQRAVDQSRAKIDPVLGKPNNPFFTRLALEVQEPDRLAKGFRLEEVDKLLFGAKQAALTKLKSEAQLINASPEKLALDLERLEVNESGKRDAILRILSMRNADNVEKQKMMNSIAVKEFQRFEGDTGSSEVQAAVMSVELINLMDHIKQNPQDSLHLRKARMLAQKRQRILRYLKRDDPQRYFWAIAKLGLTDEIVHMEFNMDRQYTDEYEVWPGRTRVRKTKKELEQEGKEKRALRKVERRARAEKNEELEALAAEKKAAAQAEIEANTKANLLKKQQQQQQQQQEQ